MEDDYNLTGDADFDSIYAGSSSGYRGFRRFLEQIQARNKELLPAWWSDANALECERAGRRDDWSSLKCAIEKSDVIEHYGDRLFPMQLRMFAEQIYGTGPGSQSGSAMLQLQVMAEDGQVHTDNIDASQLI